MTHRCHGYHMSQMTHALTVLLVAAAPAVAFAQPAAHSLVSELLKLDRAVAVREIARRPAAVEQALEELKVRFDDSIHSARDVPEQRSVRYDADALRDGLALSGIHREATGNDRFLRAFTARQHRIEGTVLLNQRKYAEAVTKLDGALAEAERLDDVWLQIITHINLAYGYLELERPAAALEACERARRLADRSNPRARALAVFNLASVQMHLRDFDAAIPLANEAAMLAKEIGNRLWEGNARLNLGVAHLELGQTAEAHDELTRARDVLLKTQDKLGIGRSMYTLALVAAAEGAFEEAAHEMERALPLIRTVDIRHSHAIEEDPREYYNTFEEAAVQLLVEWYGLLGNGARAQEYAEALEALRAKRPGMAGHRHKPGR